MFFFFFHSPLHRLQLLCSLDWRLRLCCAVGFQPSHSNTPTQHGSGESASPCRGSLQSLGPHGHLELLEGSCHCLTAALNCRRRPDKQPCLELVHAPAANSLRFGEPPSGTSATIFLFEPTAACGTRVAWTGAPCSPRANVGCLTTGCCPSVKPRPATSDRVRDPLAREGLPRKRQKNICCDTTCAPHGPPLLLGTACRGNAVPKTPDPVQDAFPDRGFSHPRKRQHLGINFWQQNKMASTQLVHGKTAPPRQQKLISLLSASSHRNAEAARCLPSKAPPRSWRCTMLRTCTC